MEILKELGPVLGLSTIIGSIFAATWTWLTRDWTGDVERAHDKYINIDRLAEKLEEIHIGIPAGTSSDLTETARRMRTEALTSLLKRSGTPSRALQKISLALLFVGFPTFFFSLVLSPPDEEVAPLINLIFAVIGLLALTASISLFFISEVRAHRHASKTAGAIIEQLRSRATCKECNQPISTIQGRPQP